MERIGNFAIDSTDDLVNIMVQRPLSEWPSAQVATALKVARNKDPSHVIRA